MSDDPNDGGTPHEPSGPPEPSAADIRTLRLQKLERLRAEGENVYPYRFDRDRTIGELRADFGDLGAGEETDVEVRIAGRLMLKREQGRLTFATLRDRDGEVQLFVSQGVLGKERFGVFNDLDRGDWVGAVGTVMVTKKGELSVKVTEFELLSKALRPLPDKWKGLSDTDQRYRQRYVDLVVNEEARAILMVRIATVQAIRDRLRERGYLEVETPVLNLIQSGATARPFVTHYNALDVDSYLRIALELPLKRLIVGGMEKVFEIGRIFRNEGLDTRHNPEFTMLETYEAFVDYTEMMDLVEDLISNAARAAIGTTDVDVRGQTISLAPPYRRATMIELIRTYADVDVHPAMSPAELAAGARQARRLLRPRLGLGEARHGALRRQGRARADRSDLRARLPARCRRWPRPIATTPPWSSGSSWWSAAVSWPTPTASSTTRSTSSSGSATRPRRRQPAIPRPATSTSTTCGPSSTACRRPAGWAWASTG